MSLGAAFPQPARDVFAILQKGPAFSNPVSAQSALMSGNISNVLSQIPEVNAANQALGWTSSKANQLSNALTALENGNATLLAHTAATTLNMPSLMGRAGAHQSVSQTISGIVGCADYLSGFGSVMGSGKAWLDKAIGYAQTVISYIQQGVAWLVSKLDEIIAFINDTVSEVLNMIAEELGLRSLWDKALQAYSDAMALVGPFVNNPCSKALIGALGTPELKTAMNVVF